MNTVTKTKTAQIQKVIEATAKEFNVDPIDIVHPHGKAGRDISTARYVCAFLLRDMLPMDRIASLLGRRNNQYAYGAIDRVYSRSQEDHSFFDRVAYLADRFGARWN